MPNIKRDPDYIDANETNGCLCANSSNPLQLTPTGKISHAKTRVYTQRYRKAWEQMPDFKGWLTSVPQQPTRAFCKYCRKNLHAHRLSLLKHTCTMKHQRGALMHQKVAESKSAPTAKRKIAQVDDDSHVQTQDAHHEEVVQQEQFKVEDDDDDDFEYIVERLDDNSIDDDEQSKDVDDGDYAEDEDLENISIKKKMKTNKNEGTNRPDTLAEAMAHVHGEYLDENEDSANVESEMVVESVDPSDQQMEIVHVRSMREDVEHQQEISMENYGNDENSTDYVHANQKEDDPDNPTTDNAETYAHSSCNSSVLGEFSDVNSEIDEPEQFTPQNSPTMITEHTNYSSNPSTAKTASPVLPVTSGSNSPALPKSKKTITLTSGGKIVTFDTSSIATYPRGSRFVLNTTDRESDIVLPAKRSQELKSEGQIKIARQTTTTVTAAPAPAPTTYSALGSSQPTPKKHIILKSVTPLVAKKPCISTHVLDTSKGLPVGGLQISLYKLMDGRWTFLKESTTTTDGRCVDLVDTSKYTFTAGRYKLHFDVDKYFTLRRIETMYPFIEIIFDVKNPAEHYHVPVLISPFGYTTYRGT